MASRIPPARGKMWRENYHYKKERNNEWMIKRMHEWMKEWTDVWINERVRQNKCLVLPLISSLTTTASRKHRSVSLRCRDGSTINQSSPPPSAFMPSFSPLSFSCFQEAVSWRVTVLLWYSGTMVQCYSCTVVQWYSGTMVQCYSCTVLQWYCGKIWQTFHPWQSGSSWPAFLD